MMYSLLSWLWYMLTRPGQRGKWGNILAFIKRLLASVLPLCLFSTLGTSSWRTSQSAMATPGHLQAGSTTLPLVSMQGWGQQEEEQQKREGNTVSWDLQPLYCSWPYNMWRGMELEHLCSSRNPRFHWVLGLRGQTLSPPCICV